MLALAATGQAAAQDTAQTAPPAILAGTVYDTVSGGPLRLAVVRVVATGATTLTDDNGRFRITTAPGEIRLEIRRIGYQPTSATVTAGPGVTEHVLYVRPVALGLAPVVVTGVDELALRIMRRVIARKHEVYAALHDFRFDAYVKFVLRDATIESTLPKSVLLITETRTSAYWEQPDKFQETILARRQSRNLEAQQNLVSVGEIVNFSRDRIDLQKYSVVSPIADDALDHYDYHMLDTLDVDGRRVFRLAIEPRSQASPLFAGMIDVADSTYDVLGIDVGVNSAVRFSFLENLRYRQRLRDAGAGRWMPYEIRLTGELRIGLPVPGLPEHMAFEHVASLDSFRFDQGNRPPNLGEFRVVVHDRADKPDSAVWAAPVVTPLSTDERQALQRIDSIESIPPKTSERVLAGVGAALHFTGSEDFFHFNRVDGPTVGAGYSWRARPGLVIRTKVAYATEDEAWQYRLGVRLRLSAARRLWVGAARFARTENRPALVSTDYNPTYRALLFRLDPLDYFREDGWSASLGMKLVDFVRLDVRYLDTRQSTLDLATDWAMFPGDRPQSPNPPITNGRMRSLRATLTYDSRPLLQEGGRTYHFQTLTWTEVTLETEVAAPSLIPTDFDYQWYWLAIERKQRTLNLGLTSIRAVGGIANGNVPPQRYFVVDYGMRALTFQEGGFNTLGLNNFSGTRAALLVVEHDFDRLLFAKSGLPVVRDCPFTLSVHGGVFWTDFVNHTPVPGDDLLNVANTPYGELGFGLGNLTPFISPFNLAAYFSWQLTSYSTQRFQLTFGLTRL